MKVFSDAEQLKFAIMADGVVVSPAARRWLAEVASGRPLTPADYASTSGLILQLEDDVWVNAPYVDHNPNFVGESDYVLDVNGDRLAVHGGGLESSARFCAPAGYHGSTASNGQPVNYYAFTHADRVRLAPIKGCAMTCRFCNIPYEDRYGIKPIEVLIEAVQIAMEDPLQPARHVLISGGTPRDEDVDFLKTVYAEVLLRFPGVDIDIMMVPVDGLIDLADLDAQGLNQLSINLEVFNPQVAARLMRQKFGRGLQWYLDYLEHAAEVLGPGRVRSMLLVGLEPVEDTLAGVAAILERGCIPVLSPFRASPSTPMADIRPPTATELEDVYRRALDLAESAGSVLGGTCPPCSHNTLTLLSDQPGYGYRHIPPPTW